MEWNAIGSAGRKQKDPGSKNFYVILQGRHELHARLITVLGSDVLTLPFAFGYSPEALLSYKA
jgi:hypothetical protein